MKNVTAPSQSKIQNPQSKILVAGVGYRWQSDASIGLIAADALARLDWPAHVVVEDLGYGAIFAAQDIAAADPPYDRLILLSGTARGRTPARIYRSEWRSTSPDDDEIQARIREAGAGVIDVDHLLVIAAHFKALPPEVLLIEVEPIDSAGGEHLSPPVAALLPNIIDLIRTEATINNSPLTIDH